MMPAVPATTVTLARRHRRRLSAALALAALSTLALAGAVALAQEAPAPAGGPAKTPPRRKWQDVAQPPLEAFPDPKPVTGTLRNGMKVFLLEDHELPTIDVTLLVRAGETDLASLFPGAPEAPFAKARAKAGLASIAGQLIRGGGTAAKTGEELDEELDAIAASVGTSAGDDQASAQLSCLSEHFDTLLGVFTEVVRRPALREERLNLMKRQRMGQIRRRDDNPAQLAGREFGRLLFGDASPFGWTEETATIESITRDDVALFYRSAFAAAPEKALLGAVGDFDAKSMLAKLDAALGDWTAEKDAARAPVAVPREGFAGPGPKVYFVKKTDVNQATVLLGHPGIQRRPGDADYPAAVVANAILGGGGFAARLMQRVRTEMGLAYGCSSRLDAALGRQGAFIMQGQTKSGSCLAMTKAMRKELERLVSEPPSADELRVAKQAILEKLVFSFDRKSDVLDRALRNEFWGFPQDELRVFQRGVAAVTAEDILRVSKKVMRPEALTTLVVGNDAEFDGKLETLGPVTTLEMQAAPAPRGGRGRRGGEGEGTGGGR